MFHASLQTNIHKFTALLIGNYSLIGSWCGTNFMTIHIYKKSGLIIWFNTHYYRDTIAIKVLQQDLRSTAVIKGNSS